MKYENYSLTWRGDLTSISSAAQHARRILKPLIDGGAHVKLEPMQTSRPPGDIEGYWDEQFKARSRIAPGIIHINCGAPDMQSKNPTGGPTVLMTHWETIDVPKHWVASINQFPYDEIWVPSRSNAEALEVHTGKPVRILPFCLDKESIKNTKPMEQIDGIAPGTFVFGTTGLWNNRKNLSDLLIAYIGEFSKADRTCMLIKTGGQNPYDPNERNKIKSMIKEIKKSFEKPDMPDIMLIQDILTQRAMDSIIARFDCFVSTSRGEGRNVTMLKAAAQGIPCIAIANGATKDIFEDLKAEPGMSSNTCLAEIPYTIEPVMQMGKYYRAADRWPRPDCGSLMNSMRSAYLRAVMNQDLEDRKELARVSRRLFVSNKLPELLDAAQPFAIQRLA